MEERDDITPIGTAMAIDAFADACVACCGVSVRAAAYAAWSRGFRVPGER
jgi:hypothetical protein